MAPEPAPGSDTFARLDSSSRMSCVLRATRRAKASGSPHAALCGRTAILSAPPRPAAVTAIVMRNMFTSASRLVIIRQAVSAATVVGFGVKPQACLHARPQFPDGAKFRDGEKLVGVGRQPEIDHAARGIERHAAGFKRAQAVDRGGDGESQFLRFRAAGIVDDAPVRHHQWAAKALIGEAPHLLGEVFRQFAPRPWTGPRSGKAADRVETSAHVDGSRRKFAAFHQRRKVLHGGARRRAEIEVDGNAGIEFDVLEHALDDRRRCVQTIAVGVERTGEHQSQAGRPVFEVLKRLLVRRRRIGVVDPLHQGPGRAGLAPGDRHGAGRARVKRLDPQAVIGLGHQALVERGAFERRLDKFAPFRLAGRRKFGGEGEFVGHGSKMAQYGRLALLNGKQIICPGRVAAA